MIQLEHGYTIFFTTEVAGVATAADSTPTATLYRNGSASGVTVTVAATATTGLYKATFTTLAAGDGWAKTDVLHLAASATIDSTSGYVGVVWDSTGDVDAVMRGTDNANTTTPPTASTNATAVRTELATELADIVTAEDRTSLIYSLLQLTDADVATLVARITGTIRTAADDATAETAQTTAIRNGLATSTNVSDAQDAITAILGTPSGASIAADIAAIDGGGGSGTGARTVTITVNDGSTALQNATVRLTEGANTFTATTNASGVATFNVDDATYTVAISKSGYSYSGTTLVVDGDETATYSMTLIVITPAASPYCNVTIPVLDQYVTAAAGVMVKIEFIRFLPSATKTGVVVNHPPRVESDSEGLVEVRLARLARYKTTYQVENEAPKVVEFSTPDAGSFTVTA